MQLNRYIDHTNLNPTATVKDIKTLCAEAVKYDFYAVCIHGCYIAVAQKELAQEEQKIAAVVGFPLGAMDTQSKAAEAKNCIDKGADEIDMVLNIGWLKSAAFDQVKSDIKAVKKAIGKAVLKVIIETCYLTDFEKKKACQLVQEAGADFVKTSTGFGSGGATLEDVKLMKSEVGGKLKIKASGDIRDRETALKYITLGVDRIGTSSGIKIMRGKNF